MADDPARPEASEATAEELAELWRRGEVAALYRAAQDAIARAPEHPDTAPAWFYFACAAAEKQAGRDVRSALARARSLDPGHAPARRFLAHLERKAGRADQAVGELGEGLIANPAAGELARDLDALTRQLDRRAAYRHYVEAALAGAPADADLLRRAGFAAREQGDLARARDRLRASLQHRPDDLALYREIAETAAAAGAPDEAEATLSQAVAAHPDSASLQCAYGQHLLQAGCLDAAETHLRRALACQSDHAPALAALARTLERAGRLEEADATLAEGQAKFRTTRDFCFKRARLQLRLNRAAEARRLIEQIDWHDAPEQIRPEYYFLAGDIYRALGEVDAAMRCYDQANARQRQQASDPAQAKAHYLARVEANLDRFGPAFVRDWPAADADQRARDPIFLVGFPRSGTTLLETALDAHPGVTVVEERPTVQPLVKFLAENGGYPDAIARASEAELAQLRQHYLAARARQLPADAGPVIVDKNPQNTVHLGVLYRLFPGMRVIFGLRHPADAVLSCYMQAFQPNPAMNNFNRLDDAAHLYDRVMTLWQRYCALLPLRHIVVPYEAMIAAFEASVTAVLDFLGLGWDEAIRGYRQTAQTSAAIRTPSRWQVAQPIYTQARYRWQPYRHHMSHVLGNLLAWAAWHGYRHHDDGTITAPGVVCGDTP